MIKLKWRIGDLMKSKKEIKKNDSKKLIAGYIKLGFIFAVTIFLVLLLRTWYLNRVNYELSVPIIKETLTQEINSNEIYNYIRENEDSIIYVGVVTDQGCRNFEAIFNEIIKDKHLENTITYLKLTEDVNIKKFVKEFNKFYDTNLKKYPAIIVFEDGKVKDILEANKNELTRNDVRIFLNNNNITSMDY